MDKYLMGYRVTLNTTTFQAGINKSLQGIKSLSTIAKNEFTLIRRAWESTAGKIATLGLGFKAVTLAKDIAIFDKKLLGLAVSAGKPQKDILSLRKDIDGLKISLGMNEKDILKMFETVYSYTNSWNAANSVMGSSAKIIKLTGGNIDTLSQALVTANKQFGLNLETAGAADSIYSKLYSIGKTVGGIDNAATIFNNIATDAKLIAGLSFDDTMKLITTASKVTSNPEEINQLSTALIKAFNNAKSISKKSGGIIFDKLGNKKNLFDLVKGLQKTYQGLKEIDKSKFLVALSSGGSREVVNSLQKLFSSNLKDTSLPIVDIGSELDKSMNNVYDQSLRLKNTLEDAAEGFLRPVDEALGKLIKYALDTKKMSGAEIMGVGAGAAILTYLSTRFGKFLGGKFGILGGVATGKTLEKMTGVIPVYVTNASEIGYATSGKLDTFKNIGAGGTGGIAGLGSKLIPALGAIGGIALPFTALAGAVGLMAYKNEKMKQAGTLYSSEGYKQAKKMEEFLTSPDEVNRLLLQKSYNDQSSQPSDEFARLTEGFSPTIENKNNVTVYINDKKIAPDKTIVDNRGSFK